MPPTSYEILVAGLVPAEILAELGEVRATSTAVSTVLSGEIVDQAALLGVLRRLRALDLDIVEVRRVLTTEAGTTGTTPDTSPDTTPDEPVA